MTTEYQRLLDDLECAHIHGGGKEIADAKAALEAHQLREWRKEYRQLRKQVVATWDRIDVETANAICKDLAQRAAGREKVSRDPSWRGIVHKPHPKLWVAAMRDLLDKGLDVYPY